MQTGLCFAAFRGSGWMQIKSYPSLFVGALYARIFRRIKYPCTRNSAPFEMTGNRRKLARAASGRGLRTDAISHGAAGSDGKQAAGSTASRSQEVAAYAASNDDACILQQNASPR